MVSIFTRIVRGEIPCYKVAETEDFLAFLDVRPQTAGHTLCIPKQEIDYIFDLDDDHLARLTLFSKRVSKALQTVVPCQRIGVAVVGLEVPHTHIHLFPLRSMADFGFGKEPATMSAEDMQELAGKVKAVFEGA